MATTDAAPLSIAAHDSALACITLNTQGEVCREIEFCITLEIGQGLPIQDCLAFLSNILLSFFVGFLVLLLSQLFQNDKLAPMTCDRSYYFSITIIVIIFAGTRLATASNKGTLIRVWDTASGALTSELRRGTQVDDFCHRRQLSSSSSSLSSPSSLQVELSHRN